MPKTVDGFDYVIDSWVIGPDEVYTRIHVFFQSAEICSCPAVVSLADWNSGNPDPKLLAALMENLIQAGNELALFTLKWPPYDKLSGKP